MPYTPNAVVTQLFSFPDFAFTMHITGAVTAADVGKAVTLDPAQANSVKLAEDGDEVYGRLETYENREQEGVVVGTIARKFRAKLPTSAAPNIGDEVVGSATAGAVKPTAAQPADALKRNRVIEVGADYAVVEQI